MFDITSIISKCLQSTDIDLLTAINYIQSGIASLKKLSLMMSLKNCYKKNNFLLNVEKKNFALLRYLRTAYDALKKKSGELSSDEPIIDKFENFKVKVYFTTLDIITTQISERFNDYSIPLFKDLALFSHKRLKEIEKTSCIPDDAFKAFCEVYSEFINADSLRKEYIQFASSYFSFEKTISLPKKLHADITLQSDTENEVFKEHDEYNEINKNEKIENSGTIGHIFQVCCLSGLKEIFPYMYTSLSIAVTLPVSSSSLERAFSKLKLIKSRLRSAMTEERLEALMIMSCEIDVPIDVDAVVDNFASNSSVLVKLLT